MMWHNDALHDHGFGSIDCTFRYLKMAKKKCISYANNRHCSFHQYVEYYLSNHDWVILYISVSHVNLLNTVNLSTYFI